MRIVTEFILTILSGILFGLMIAAGVPWHYLLGMLLFVLIVFVALTKPVLFLAGLFLLRPALNQFLISIRFMDHGLGGLLSLFLIILALFFVMTSVETGKDLKTPLIGLYGLFCFVSVFSLTSSPNMLGALKQLLNFFSIFAIMTLLLIHVNTHEKLKFIGKAILISPIFPLCFGLIDFVINRGRFHGFFGHPNILAFYLLVIIGALLFQLDELSKDIRLSPLRMIYTLLLLMALVFTETRSAWIAFLMMGGVYLLLFNRKLLIPGLIVIIGVCFLPTVQERFMNIFSFYGDSVIINKNSSLGWRLTAWQDLIEAGIEKPFFGHGIDSVYVFVEGGLGAHNDYLRFFVDQGLIGVVLYFAPFVYVLIKAFDYIKYKNDDFYITKLSGFFICFIPAFLVMSISENLANYVIIQWYFWGIAALYFGVLNKRHYATTQE